MQVNLAYSRIETMKAQYNALLKEAADDENEVEMGVICLSFCLLFVMSFIVLLCGIALSCRHKTWNLRKKKNGQLFCQWRAACPSLWTRKRLCGKRGWTTATTTGTRGTRMMMKGTTTDYYPFNSWDITKPVCCLFAYT